MASSTPISLKNLSLNKITKEILAAPPIIQEIITENSLEKMKEEAVTEVKNSVSHILPDLISEIYIKVKYGWNYDQIKSLDIYKDLDDYLLRLAFETCLSMNCNINNPTLDLDFSRLYNQIERFSSYDIYDIYDYDENDEEY